MLWFCRQQENATFSRKWLHTFCCATFLGCLLLFSGCLDIPDEPITENQIESYSLYIVQPGIADSSQLKINPKDSATLHLSIFPRQFKKQVSVQWFADFIEDPEDSTSARKLLGEGFQYGVSPETSILQIPNIVVITDDEGNQVSFPFNIVINNPPYFSGNTVPAEGDVLYGTTKTAVLFKWQSFDDDAQQGDKLTHTLLIDDQEYNVGSLHQVYQSGFSEGEHTFRIIVKDSYGDTDSLPEQTFYMADTLGGEQ